MNGERVTASDRHWLGYAIQLAGRCQPAPGAFSVGAVLVGADGNELAHGHSRDTDPTVHAEESALAKLAPDDPRLPGATLYSSLEPCSQRASRPVPCARLIVRAGIGRVVLAWREPDRFVRHARGCGDLAAAGVTVVEVPEFAAAARLPNAHLLG